MQSGLSIVPGFIDSHAADLRVLQLLPDLAATPVTRHVLALTQAVAAEGGQVTVASAGGRMEAQLRRAGAEHIHHLPARGGLLGDRGAPALLHEVRRRGITHLHVHLPQDGLAARGLADAAGVPLLMTCHACPPTQGYFTRRSAKRRLVGRPLMVQSRYLAAQMVAVFGVPAAEVHVVPTGIDIATFDEEAVTSARTIALASHWGVIEDPREIVLVPQASTDPGWLTWMLGAVSDAAMPDAVWVLVGEGPGAHARVASLLVKAGISDRVRWVETCDDWPAAYKLAGLVINAPGVPQPLCLAALEAQAMGRPIIATDTGAAAEALLPGATGWLIADRDRAALVAAVGAAFARDPLDKAATAMAARNFIAQHQSLRALQAATLAHYRAAHAAG